MTAHDSSSFSAGEAAGTRVAACIARLTALELVEGSRWWNRRRRRVMARALVAYAEEMEGAADAPWPEAAGAAPEASLRAVLARPRREALSAGGGA